MFTISYTKLRFLYEISDTFLSGFESAKSTVTSDSLFGSNSTDTSRS